MTSAPQARTASRNASRADNHETRAGLLPLIVLLIAYGSLYPFEFVALDRTARSWRDFALGSWMWTTLGDVLGNVLLFMPLGALVAWRHVTWTQSTSRRVLVTALVVAFAFLLQVGQMYLPSRDPAMADVACNAVGFLAGTIVGAWAGQWAGPRRVVAPLGFGVVLVIGWVMVELAPLVPTVDWQNVKRVLKPLVQGQWGAVGAWHAFTFALVTAAVVGLSKPGLSGRGLALMVAATVACVALAKPFIMGADLKLSWFAGAATAFIAMVWTHGPRPVTHRMAQRPEHRQGQRLSALALGVLWLDVVTQGLRPFQWRVEPAAFDWVPFRSMLQGSMVANAWSLVSIVVVCGTFLSLADGARVLRRWAVPLLLMTVAALEAVQTHIPGRTADITPLLLAVGTVLWLPRPWRSTNECRLN